MDDQKAHEHDRDGRSNGYLKGIFVSFAFRKEAPVAEGACVYQWHYKKINRFSFEGLMTRRMAEQAGVQEAS
jgi:hypothetical protein